MKKVYTDRLYHVNNEKSVLNVIGWYSGLHFLINSSSHPCAYVGISKSSIPSGSILNFQDFSFIDCHWGVTWNRWGDNKYLPENYYWIGWDYAHAGDYTTLYSFGNEKKHDLNSIIDECRNVIDQIQNIKLTQHPTGELTLSFNNINENRYGYYHILNPIGNLFKDKKDNFNRWLEKTEEYNNI